MQKIPSLYLRDHDTALRYVSREPNPACEWVFAGEGEATVKWDGTCVMLDDRGRWFARHQVRPGKTPPEGYIPVEHDPVTGKTQGWYPMEDSGYRRQHAEALVTWDRLEKDPWLSLDPGTYELIGPKVGSNPHGLAVHALRCHGDDLLEQIPTDWDALRATLLSMDQMIGYFEGVVWHHPDGRMAKIKTRDFPRE